MNAVAQAPVVRAFHHAGTGTWSYVVSDRATGQAAIVDPVLDFDARSGRVSHGSAQRLLDAVRDGNLHVRWLLETHVHADHLSAAHWLSTQLPDAAIAIGRGIREVQRTFAPVFDGGHEADTGPSPFDRLFEDDERFAIGSLEVHVIPVPGHTRDSIAYLIGDALFTGDSLFMPDCGTARCDFPGGDAALLHRSIHRLFELPDATRVFVCHDYGTGTRAPACESTIGAQKRDNIHVNTAIDEATFVGMREARDATLELPALILPSLQVNLRAGRLPEPAGNGIRYLRIPLDQF